MAMIVSSLMMMEQIDGTALTTALPAMATDFHVDIPQTSITLTVYMLGLAALIPASGRIAERFGNRVTLCWAIIVFLGGSLLGGLAPNLPVLALARLVQGLGGAMMVPVGRLVILQNVPKSELMSAMAWVMLTATIGPMVGPVLGGVLTSLLSWRWVFYINIPLGLLAIGLIGRFIPQVRVSHPPPFDLKGNVWCALGLAGLIFGLELLTHSGTARIVACALLVLPLVCSVAYIRHAGRVTHPLLDLSLLRVNTFRISVIAGACTRIATGSIIFLVPSMLQTRFGASAVQSGLITFIAPIGALAMRFAAPRLYRARGYRAVMCASSLSVPGVCLLLALYNPAMGTVALLALLAGHGVGQTTVYTGYNTIAYADMPPARMGAATSLYSTIQQVMLTLGICFSAGVLTSARLVLPPSLQIQDYRLTFILCGLVAMIALPVLLRLSPNAGAAVSGHDHTAAQKNRP
ncbi:MFS transporter [Komagataeibacter xylinus]|uniref:Multidrug efflux MFS transporter n=1 Tax=Komagataeibacter xylinus TaxID=28448 RepID=A0A857FTL0_KOMXY|nr:MFS transporter [Komagataeibacter xylinus]QHC35794.1 multidrug efflux MFS transporter [Komagataeibacter xylinus]